MTRLSIRWRLTLWYAAALAVILCVFCGMLLLLTRQQLMNRNDGALREELQELALEVRLASSTDEFARQFQARFWQHDIYDFLVTGSTGRVLFRSSGLTQVSTEALPRVTPSNTIQSANHQLGRLGPYRVSATTAIGKEGRWVVQAMTSLAPFNAEMHMLRLMMVTLLPMGIVGALIVGYFLADRALAPVKQIVGVANAITISSLNRRIEVANPHDEIGSLATTLNLLIARLESAVVEIRRFTADASHEIRTPIAALRSEAESVLRSRRSPEEYEQTLAVVVEEATRLGRLADQLLNLSRHDAGIIPRSHECVRLDALLHDVADHLRPVATARGVTLACENMPSCEMQGDDIRLSQLFFNIVENAVKYTRQGGNVTVRGRVLDDHGVFEVEDTGIGIPEVHLPRVFDRFYRVDPARNNQSGGAGLGLSIALAAVVDHHGEIKIASRPGVGTTVVIRLPNVDIVSYGVSEELGAHPAD